MSEFIKSKLIGTWRLVQWVYKGEDGREVNYFGENAKGILMYDEHGNMNAQLMRANRLKFKSNDINGGTPDETKQAFDSYIGYFGKYEEVRPREIVHRVQGGLFPNWLDAEQVRFASLDGNFLHLSTPPVPVDGKTIIFYITWQRVIE